MDIWFIRCNGDTAHNDPATTRYIPGEPPAVPRRSFNYLHECLSGGFARVGWPGTSDLRHPGWRDLWRQTYAEIVNPDEHDKFVGYLEQFVRIPPGDLVLLPIKPSPRNTYNVHLGVVVSPRGLASSAVPRGVGSSAYYYFHDILAGHWYENAHRIDVNWHPEIHNIGHLGGVWRWGFRPVRDGSDHIVNLARRVGLLP
jgi:hypothetical protein